MCGIGAVIGFDAPGTDPVAIARGLVACLAHRGPDAAGVRTTGAGTVLAHARLSIIDLSPAGTQPLGNEDGTVWVVCNGEIYNHERLREALVARGHQFRSRSDSEVLVHLWEDHGRAMLDRLEGMFAFVLVDSRTGEVLVARDRLGKKPVVYAATPQGVAIASEIPALRGVPGIDWSIDPEAVALYLLRNLRHIPDPWTIYRGVRRLAPGHAMLIRGARIVETWRYWHPQFEPMDMSADELLERFDAAVRVRMVADVEVGALLSGGVDSTAIIDSMRRQGASEIRTYALGRDADDEELVRARRMATHYGTRHTEVWFDADRHHDHLELMLRRHGEPIMLLPLGHAYELFSRVRDDGVRVVMTGHGADEVFFGYDGHRRTAMLSNLLQYMPAMAQPLAAGAASLFKPGSAPREALLVAGAADGHRKARLYEDELETLVPKLLRGDTADQARRTDIDGWFQTWFSPGNVPRAYVDEAAILGLFHENAHSVTIAGDLPAMAASVEVRCPFLDADLVERGLRVPYVRKVGPGLRPSQAKLILKQALADRLPHDVLYAQKRGFGYHIQERDLLLGAWRDRVETVFSRPRSLDSLIDMVHVRRLWSNLQHGSGTSAQLVAKLYALCLHHDLSAASTA